MIEGDMSLAIAVAVGIAFLIGLEICISIVERYRRKRDEVTMAEAQELSDYLKKKTGVELMDLPTIAKRISNRIFELTGYEYTFTNEAVADYLLMMFQGHTGSTLSFGRTLVNGGTNAEYGGFIIGLKALHHESR